MTSEIEWVDYVEPVVHRRMAEITEENVLQFCREYELTLSFEERKIAPFPDGRKQVMMVTGLPGHRHDKIEVPFWVQSRGENIYQMSTPRSDWKVINSDGTEV